MLSVPEILQGATLWLQSIAYRLAQEGATEALQALVDGGDGTELGAYGTAVCLLSACVALSFDLRCSSIMHTGRQYASNALPLLEVSISSRVGNQCR